MFSAMYGSEFAYHIVSLVFLLLGVMVCWVYYSSQKKNLRTTIENLKKIEQAIGSQANIIEQIHDSIIITDIFGAITHWNKGSENLFGYDSNEMLGENISCIFPKDIGDRLEDEVRPKIIESGEHYEEFNLINEMGEDLYVQVSMSTIYNECGVAVGIIGYAIDISERKKFEEKLLEISKLNEEIFKESPIGMAIYNYDGLCLDENKIFENIFSEVREEVLAMDYNNSNSSSESELHVLVRKAMLSNCAEKAEISIIDSLGKGVYIDIRVVPLKIGSGERLLLMADDITARRVNENALKESEGLLEKAQTLTKIGHWRLIPSTGEVTGSAEFFRVFGLSADAGLKFESFVEAVHPEDRERNIAAVQRGAEHGECWDIEHRIVCPNGVEKWVNAIGGAVFDENNGVTELIGTVHDITRQKLTELELNIYRESLEELVQERTADLANARDEAEHASAAKSEFLSSMSHELRTPLNAILGFGQLLEMDPNRPLDRSQKKYVSQIIQGGNHLLALINDILDLEKIAAGNSELTTEDIQIVDVIHYCFEFTQSMAADNNIQLNIQYNTMTSTVVRADATRTKQILLNLISNAIKYNSPGGSVTVSCYKSAPYMLRINVEDSGKGIPKEREHELFKPFNRLGAEMSDVQGTGIGLAVCKDLIELMGGRIGFKNNAGIGACFWFELPMMEEQSEASIKSVVETVITPMKIPPKLDISVLYVEDNKANVCLMKSICESIVDLDLITVASAEEGIKIARDQMPDIIILDVNLPGISGIEAVKYLRQSSDTAKIPVIGLSAAAMEVDIGRGLSAGFDRYLTKPIDVEKFIDVLEELMVASD